MEELRIVKVEMFDTWITHNTSYKKVPHLDVCSSLADMNEKEGFLYHNVICESSQKTIVNDQPIVK